MISYKHKNYKYKMVVRDRQDSTDYSTYYFGNIWQMETSLNDFQLSPYYTPGVMNIYYNNSKNWKVYQKYVNGECVVDNSMKF